MPIVRAVSIVAIIPSIDFFEHKFIKSYFEANKYLTIIINFYYFSTTKVVDTLLSSFYIIYMLN